MEIDPDFLTKDITSEWKKAGAMEFSDVDGGEEKKSMEALKSITLQKFSHSFERWKPRMDRCVASNREYFEGDKSVTV